MIHKKSLILNIEDISADSSAKHQVNWHIFSQDIISQPIILPSVTMLKSPSKGVKKKLLLFAFSSFTSHKICPCIY